MSERASSDMPDKGDRVQICTALGGSRSYVGRHGTVERFFIGHFRSVGVRFDDGDRRVFKPEELDVIPDQMKAIRESLEVCDA